MTFLLTLLGVVMVMVGWGLACLAMMGLAHVYGAGVPLTRPERAPRRRLRTATARMKTSTLVDMLEMRGWGALNDVGRKGTRATLRALVLSLPFGTGEGYATVPQIAYKAGYSSRHWVGEMLADLEGIGLI
ncbi:MAG: hypothetical protein E6423_17430, partial [Clostridium sp.]|nr:hypothetical protein [Clostridium sp.]